MNQINCNIIKDLLPSYFEHICCEDTNILVKNHLKECPSCSSFAKMMTETEFSPYKVNLQEIDYMKKVKNHFLKKNLFLFALLLLFVIAGTIVVLCNINHDTAVTPQIYYIILPSLLLATHYTLSDCVIKNKRRKWQYLIGGIGLLALGCSIFLIYVCWHWGQTKQYPLEASKMGPFISNQFLVLSFIHLAFFIGCCILSMKTKESFSIPMTIHATGCCINLSFIFTLHTLSVAALWFQTQSRILLTFVIEGILTAIILRLLERHRI